jgi:hypothetical protein
MNKIIVEFCNDPVFLSVVLVLSLFKLRSPTPTSLASIFLIVVAAAASAQLYPTFVRHPLASDPTDPTPPVAPTAPTPPFPTSSATPSSPPAFSSAPLTLDALHRLVRTLGVVGAVEG